MLLKLGPMQALQVRIVTFQSRKIKTKKTCTSLVIKTFNYKLCFSYCFTLIIVVFYYFYYYFVSRDVLNTSQVTHSFKDLMLSEEAVPENKTTTTFADDDKLSGLKKKPAITNDADNTVR